MRSDFFPIHLSPFAVILFILTISATMPHVIMALVSDPAVESVPVLWSPPPPSLPPEVGINFDFAHGIRAGWNPGMLALMHHAKITPVEASPSRSTRNAFRFPHNALLLLAMASRRR